MRAIHLIVALLCLGRSALADPHARTPPRPEGEYDDLVAVAPYRPEVTVLNTDKQEMEVGASKTYCASYSSWTWKVAVDRRGTHFQLVNRERYDDHEDPLPAQVVAASCPGAKIAGYRYVERVDDGWLVAWERGEWGGSVCWFSTDGKKAKALFDGNVHGFVRVGGRILGLAGLAHMTWDAGSLLELRRGTSGWTAAPFAKLPAAPNQWAKESDSSLLVATDEGLTRVTADGVTTQLHRPVGDWGSAMDEGGSLSIGSKGEVFIGMRHAVVRLTPRANPGSGYQEDWLVLPECRTTRVLYDTAECKCTAPRTAPR